MTSLEDLIEEYRQVVEEKIVDAEATKKKLDQLIELQKVKNKRLKGEKLADEEIQSALNLLCWGNYAGCCSPSKNCPWNNVVSDVLGVNYEELYEEKKKTVSRFLIER